MMKTVDPDEFTYLINRYKREGTGVIPIEKFSWKPSVVFTINGSLYDYKSWLEENNIPFLFLYSMIAFKNENDALLFKMHWS